MIGPTEQPTADDSDYNPETTDRPQVSARILRRRGPAPVVRRPGVITLSISPRGMAAVLRRIQKKVLAAERRQNPASNDRNFTFGVSELSYHPAPRQVDIQSVARILEEERPFLLAQVSQDNAARPMHAGQNFTFDAIVRVILSQASTNEGALDAQQCMIQAYPYMVNGVKVIGTIPNYHLMRVQSVQKLELALMRAGLYKIKAKAIKGCLDEIYSHNLSFLGPKEVAYRFNVPNEPDFVPGLLSLDYLSAMFVREGKQAVFDYLVSLPLIGTKTASCIMAFRMGIPVFAVDTHVGGMAKLLGWVPQDATEEEMCSHLDFKIADDGKKLDLHQDFWRHRRTCAKCSGRSLPGSWAYENTVCLLERFITRPPPKRVIGNRSGRLQPRPRVVKKKVDEDALRAQGMIKVTYQVDDDFDAATGALVMRTVWIQDYSMLEAEVQMLEEEDEETEEIEVGSESIRRSLEAQSGLI
jgi:endonuclease III